MLRLQFHPGKGAYCMHADRNLGLLSAGQVGDFQVSFADALAVFVEQIEIERSRWNCFRAEVFCESLA